MKKVENIYIGIEFGNNQFLVMPFLTNIYDTIYDIRVHSFLCQDILLLQIMSV